MWNEWNKEEFQRLVTHQLYTFFNCQIELSPYLEKTIQRVEPSFQKRRGKYFESGVSLFHSGQYCIMLHCLSRVMWEMDGSGENAEKVYYLNRALNAVDLFYEVNLPGVWGCEHPLGSIMGRASYSDRFFFYQGCTVGANHGEHPIIGSDVIMYPNSKILGKCTIGDHVVLSANTYIKDIDIPDNCLVFGQCPDIIIKQKTVEKIEAITGTIWKYQRESC